VFNKKNKKSIILLHGLYTSAGFWLPYLNLFNEFRIITFNINYDCLLKAHNVKSYLQEYLTEFLEYDNIVAVISHSFGTIVSDIAFDSKQYTVFKICPVAFSSRLDTQNFIVEIENKTSLSKENIFEYMDLVNDFTTKFKNQLNCNGAIYIPNRDGFFSYEVPKSNKTEFNGDHFNIALAISNIIGKLSNR
jgi:hypothetical protein